jgi:hypothetical protein
VEKSYAVSLNSETLRRTDLHHTEDADDDHQHQGDAEAG